MKTPVSIHDLPDFWDARRAAIGKPYKSTCAAELRLALAAMVPTAGDCKLCIAEDCEHEWGCGDLRAAYEIRNAAMARVAELESQIESLVDASGFACECPPPGCDCAGCSYARDVNEELKECK
jgi:hypothetical protein